MNISCAISTFSTRIVPQLIHPMTLGDVLLQPMFSHLHFQPRLNDHLPLQLNLLLQIYVLLSTILCLSPNLFIPFSLEHSFRFASLSFTSISKSKPSDMKFVNKLSNPISFRIVSIEIVDTSLLVTGVPVTCQSVCSFSFTCEDSSCPACWFSTCQVQDLYNRHEKRRGRPDVVHGIFLWIADI